MALSANSVVEVRTAGNDTNGGGFVTGAAGTDYSQADAKRTATGVNDSTTDAVAVGTGVITSATAAFTSAIVGNIIYLQGGTGGLAAGWYQVTVFTSATSITVDRNVAAGTGITMNIGGALASLGMAGGYGLVSGAIIYIKAGTYTISSATPNISGGCFSSTLVILHVQGYQTARGDLGTKPLLQASGISTFTIYSATGADHSIANLSFDGAGLTASVGCSIRGYGYACHGANFTGGAFAGVTAAIFVNCTGTGCSTTTVFTGGSFLDCVAYDNSAIAFGIGIGQFAFRCIADSCSGVDGFSVLDAAVVNCVAYNCGSDGFFGFGDNCVFQNCIAENSGAFGFNLGSSDAILLINNATFNNTSGAIGNAGGKGIIQIGSIAGSASFFVDAANQNFALNTTAGAGAAVRAAGFPGVLPIGGTGYLDIGALQHQDPASSGGGLRLAGAGGLAAGA